MIREKLLALADELEGMDCREGCSTCPADGTKDCRGDLSCEEAVARAAARRIREIAGHDACEDTTVSAYDLLGDDDREALAWVREHGGLEAVKASIHQGAMEHGCLLKVAEMLGTSIYDGTSNADALLDKLEKRLMPEGMEWPKVDGEPVDFNTGYGPSLGVLEAVSIYNNGACEVMSHDGIVKNATEIHVSKPKVLDADGVEIRVVDTVWTTYGLGPFGVTRIVYADQLRVIADDEENGHLNAAPKNLTHRAPVLAADGEPLEVGQTVWSTNYGAEYEVCKVDQHSVTVEFWHEGIATHGVIAPYHLTHAKPEPPDSWERVEEDAGKNPFDYCKDVGHRLDTCENAERFKSRDLVRRCCALAERGE